MLLKWLASRHQMIFSLQRRGGIITHEDASRTNADPTATSSATSTTLSAIFQLSAEPPPSFQHSQMAHNPRFMASLSASEKSLNMVSLMEITAARMATNVNWTRASATQPVFV